MENSLINVALVFPKEGSYTLSLANIEGEIVASETFDVTYKVSNIRFKKTIHGDIDEHSMAEIDGDVFLVEGKRQPVDEDVVRLCSTQILIMDEVGGWLEFLYLILFLTLIECFVWQNTLSLGRIIFKKFKRDFMNIFQWALYYVEYGSFLSQFNSHSTYTISDFEQGVNQGSEFSEPHMCIVISPNPLNKGNSFVAIPITEYTLDDDRHWDKIVLKKEDYDFLSKDSSVHITAIRQISQNRIIRLVRPYIPSDLQKEIKNKIASIFCGSR